MSLEAKCSARAFGLPKQINLPTAPGCISNVLAEPEPKPEGWRETHAESVKLCLVPSSYHECILAPDLECLENLRRKKLQVKGDKCDSWGLRKFLCVNCLKWPSMKSAMDFSTGPGQREDWQ